ncbi:MAG: protein transport protein S31 [Sclerophora amabilis]|nr:MAG: protein transport protein S31 [Sclerophora amabilis]
MVRLREIPRTATFAWSPGSGLPFIATGTRAGAVDAEFSSETQLELWDLGLENAQQGVELEPAASISTDSRFHDIAWGKASSDHPKGIIAGALENGSLDLWDAEAALTGQSNASMSRTSKHSAAIKSLQFNPFKPELLATAGVKGELFISDLNNVENPFRLGSTAARADDIETVDWNKKVPHILVTGSNGGFVTVWDVKSKKASLTLNNLGRKPVSAVAWDPEKSTRLITAIPDDTNPLILVWDLRNSNAPEKTLKAHEQGVLSLSWCQQDSDLLLSCGKDNRTICWNPQTGQSYGEFPTVTSWTFQTRWNPHNPSLLATASFDGKISIQTIQNTRKPGSQTTGAQQPALDGEDFFNSAQTEPQGATFSLPKPPKWLERPTGASFGFGGKVVSFGPADLSATSVARKSKVQISNFAIDSDVGTAADGFEKALENGDYSSICETRIAEAKTEEEKADWKVIEALIATDPRKKLVDYLGIQDNAPNVSDGDSKLDAGEDKVSDLPTAGGEIEMNGSGKNKINRLSAFFDNSADADGFLSDISATKGANTDNPFHIFGEDESESDKRITRAVLRGQFDQALNVCLEEDRLSDAFMIAICGGQKCIDKAKSVYFSKKSEGPSFVRLLSSVTDKNLWDIVYNADLASWKEVMAALCTFADKEEFPDLCEALGSRLEEGLKQGQDNADLRKDASFCFLAGSKLEKVVAIWIEELNEDEATGLQDQVADSSFSLHAQSLQKLIEKVTVFREVTGFQDQERNQSTGWKLAPLYDKYIEYADVVAAHGHLHLAERYLDLLPPQYAAAEVARNRVKQASRKDTPQTSVRQPAVAAAARNSTRPQPVTAGFQPAQQSTQQPAQQPPAPSNSGFANPYAPPMSVQPSNPYAPSNTVTYGAQTPMQQTAGMPPQPPSFGGYNQSQRPGGPPPQNFNSSPSVPPPSRAMNVGNWNDTPMVTKPPTSRQGTPAAGPPNMNSQFPNPSNQAPPPPPQGTPYGFQQRATPPLPPPPRGSALPTRNSSHSGPPQTFQQPDRPPSAAANAYAPPTSTHSGGLGLATPPAIPRGASPYNPPPSGAPPSNRYAPAPQPQGSMPPSQQDRQKPPPPPPQGMGRPGVHQNNSHHAPRQDEYSSASPRSGAPNPYAPNPQAPSTMIQQNQSSMQGIAQGPPQGPPLPGSRPGTGQSHPSASSTPAPQPSKYPAGDRSHIPNDARPIYEVLNAEVQRVKSRAPASFKVQVANMEKRVNILFDHLNNEDLLRPDTIESMQELAQAVQNRNYETAEAVGVKALIAMGRATPDNA